MKIYQDACVNQLQLSDSFAYTGIDDRVDSLVVTCWEMAYLLAHLCVILYCGFVTFPCGVLGQVYLIVLIPDLCLLTYFDDFA